MKNDPYAKLGGLDQLLFKDDVPKQRNNTTTQQPHNETTLSRDNEAAGERASDATGQRDNVPAKPRRDEPATQRSTEAARTRVSAPAGHRPNVRKDERHSHDIFHDQVRWMNRVKLDIEEGYSTKVTSNAIVQLALDLFISDYEAHGEDSALIRTLVLGQPGVERGGR